MGRIQVVVGGQFGSEGKGAVGARLARSYGGDDAVVRVAGPNAGHTAYDEAGNRFAFRQLPVASVVSPHARVVIGAGSEIDIDVLVEEIELAERFGHKVRDRLSVDGSATVLTTDHKVAESESGAGLVAKIGSTGKGVGAARADRIMRKAQTFEEVAPKYDLEDVVAFRTSGMLNRILNRGGTVMIEGTQGYGLGIHTEFYPQSTSSDCRAIDFLAMAGVNPWGHDTEVWVVLRVYPIRVAGNSGPLEGETTWEELGLPAEITTVTKKIRRVGAWDSDLAEEAVLANGGGAVVRIALTMVDQKFPWIAGRDGHGLGLDPNIPEHQELMEFIGDVEFDAGARVALVGTGPTTMVYR